MAGSRLGDREAAASPQGQMTATPRLRVVLVNMPWARVDAPSIQCGLLQSAIRAAGHECDTWYVNLELAASIGATAYSLLADAPSDRVNLIGEWLFSYAAFGAVTSDEQYIADNPEVERIWRKAYGRGTGHMASFRREVLPRWVDDLADRPEWRSVDVVGFSSTFWQNTSSLALGRRLKDRYPTLPLVYGGANFDGEMGTEFAQSVRWLDYVVTGEGDVAFSALVDALARGAPDERIPGVLHPPGGPPDPPEGPRIASLDGLPTPDYHDYFTTLDALGPESVLGTEKVKLPVEFSRGCWWGEKHHCTFCGLNALGMTYRAKLPDRALSELTSLLADYPTTEIEAVDNILDMSYITTLCTALAQRRWDVSLFFEVKANLTRDQLAILRQAGVRRIQPGIESLSTAVLGLMRKGSSKLLNLRLLKWARYYGINVSWNLLAGFPGETEADYAEQLALIPRLHHLQPPDATARVWLERFSPFFTDPSLGFCNVRPRSSYRHIYPGHIDHARIAYFFDYDARDVVSEETFGTLQAATARWTQRWTTKPYPSLSYRRLPGKLVIIDRRGEQGRQAVLTGWAADAYEACGDNPRTAAKVTDQLSASGANITTAQVEATLMRCCRSGVMAEEEGKFLSLALPENPGW
jgi:ribosomal peptide maturation radical SAM protein 1